MIPREGKGVLTQNHRQEYLCRAYIQAVAARCGMSVSLPNPDYGIDLSLNDIAVAGSRRFESGWKIDVQAKSTTQAKFSRDSLVFDLEVKAHEILRQPNPGCPRILVVLVLPEQEAEWMAQSADELVLRTCAYWGSLRGLRATRNRRTTRVLLSRKNVFSPDALTDLLGQLKRGEWS
jgi:hypothetical protein